MIHVRKAGATAVVFLLFIFLCPPIYSTTFYVSTTGNDSNPGTLNKPFATLQKAADSVVAGDSVLVRTGTYAGLMIKNKSGTANAWIVFKPYRNDVVTIDIYRNPSSLWRAVHIDGASYIEVNGFKMTDTNPLYDSENPDDYSLTPP